VSLCFLGGFLQFPSTLYFVVLLVRVIKVLLKAEASSKRFLVSAEMFNDSFVDPDEPDDPDEPGAAVAPDPVEEVVDEPDEVTVPKAVVP
jgi:hypothetical protein